MLVDREGFSVSVSVPYSTVKSPIPVQEKSAGTVLRDPDVPYRDVGEGILYYPLHEVLKHSMRSSKVTIVNQTVPLREFIPDYQLQDLPAEILERLEGGQSLHQLQQDSVEGGFFLRKFPSFQQAERDSTKMRPDIRKMVCVHVCVHACVYMHLAVEYLLDASFLLFSICSFTLLRVSTSSAFTWRPCTG